MRNDHVFDRYWHHCFQLLEKAGESDFLAYLQTEHFQKDAGLWTATWRAAVLDPGYGSYSLNAVDSFWKLLDQYVPEEKSLPLRQVMERYEHTGRVLQNDGKWSALCVEPSTLVTPSLVGEASTELSPRLDWKGDKQVGRMSCRTLERLLAQEAPLMLNVAVQHRRKDHCTEAAQFIRLLARSRARAAPPLLRSSATAAYVTRWSALLSFAAARALAASLLSLPLAHTANVDGDPLDLSDLLGAAHEALPPSLPSRLPPCG